MNSNARCMFMCTLVMIINILQPVSTLSSTVTKLVNFTKTNACHALQKWRDQVFKTVLCWLFTKINAHDFQNIRKLSDSKTTCYIVFKHLRTILYVYFVIEIKCYLTK